MPWQLVGIGRKAAPALDPQHADYRAFWHATLDVVARFATNPDEAQHLLDSLPTHTHLLRYPNCSLFGQLGARTSIVQRTFLYAPFLDVVQSDAICAAAALKIAPPRTGTLESWYPVPFDELRSHDGEQTFRAYKVLVLRVVLILRCIKTIHEERNRAADDKSREQFTLVEQQMYHWLDTHQLLMVAIDQLGHVPGDQSPAMQVLMERYAPDVHMAFCENELPDLSGEVERASFFTQSVGARKEDPLVYTFSKALPHRCEVREVAVKVAEVSAYNAGYFGFIKIALAAMFLGIYRRTNYRAGWRLRYAVYRLFFFTMDRRLLQFRAARRSPSGAPLPLGGSAAALATDYNLHDLCDAVLTPLSPSRRKRAEAANTRLQYTSYTSIVAQQYAAAHAAHRKQSAGRQKSATDMRAEATRRWTSNFVPPAPPGANDHAHYAWDEPAPADADRLQNSQDLVRAGIVDPKVVPAVDSVVRGLYVANAMERLTYEKNCGEDYYEQRRAANLLPSSGIKLGDGSSPPPPKPAPRGTTLAYKDAYKGMLPCDRTLPSEEALQRDAIIYHWISTMMLHDKQTPAKKRKKPVDEEDDDPEEEGEDEEGEKPARKSQTEREYIFQNAINLAVREYLIFALQRWLQPLRYELCGRVSWASWEESVMIFGDGLRRHLDALYVDPCPLSSFLTSYSSYQWMTNAARARPINNHYTSEKEPFIAALKRLMKAKINNGGYGDKPLTRVLPRETDVLLQHLLNAWRYPRVAPTLQLDRVPRMPGTEPFDEPSGTDSPVFEQFRERIVSPQLVYMIEPVPTAPVPGEVLRDREAFAAYVREEYVDRGRFPLGIFHAEPEVLARFAACRSAYHLAPSDPVVKDFVNWLADHNDYQFYLIRAYCKVVERYMEIHTFALPRHIAEHQLNTLRAQFCVPDKAPPPKHLMRSLVCLGCKRCASVFPSPNQRHSAMAIGNDEVRFVSRTDDDEVYERVCARNFMPLPLDQLLPAPSWTNVLQVRSQPSAPVYDRYCAEPLPAALEPRWRRQPEGIPEMPIAPEQEDLERYAKALFADTFTAQNRALFAEPTDRRRLIYDAEHPNPVGRPLAHVARGKGRLGEMDFDAALWKEVDRRMRIIDGGGPEHDRSFLLLGHSIEGADTKRYSEIKWCDTTQRIKAESKKTKQAAAEYQSIMTIVDERQRAQKLKAYQAKRRRNADSMARFALCARRRMLEIDFCGRALRAAHLYVAGRAHADDNDCILACCDCLARVWSTQARAIGDRAVCTQCYQASKFSGGAVAQRTIRGESTKSVSATTLQALDSNAVNRTRSLPLQTQLSPSFSALCSQVVPLGTTCTMDSCKAYKTDEQEMFGLEVLLDTDVGNETYAYVFFCAKHAKMYARMFRVVTRLPFSTLKLCMMHNRRDFDEVVTRGSYLDDVMRRAAHSSGIGSQVRAEEELKRQKKAESAKQRRQRMLAIAESTRQREAASSAVVR